MSVSGSVQQYTRYGSGKFCFSVYGLLFLLGRIKARRTFGKSCMTSYAMLSVSWYSSEDAHAQQDWWTYRYSAVLRTDQTIIMYTVWSF